jgi:hypothetical protein
MDDDLASDLLFGAGAIAEDLFGQDTKQNRRRVYHLHQQGHLPTFRLGGEKGQIVGRRSTIRQHIAERERETTTT